MLRWESKAIDGLLTVGRGQRMGSFRAAVLMWGRARFSHDCPQHGGRCKRHLARRRARPRGQGLLLKKTSAGGAQEIRLIVATSFSRP